MRVHVVCAWNQLICGMHCQGLREKKLACRRDTSFTMLLQRSNRCTAGTVVVVLLIAGGIEHSSGMFAAIELSAAHTTIVSVIVEAQ